MTRESSGGDSVVGGFREASRSGGFGLAEAVGGVLLFDCGEGEGEDGLADRAERQT